MAYPIELLPISSGSEPVETALAQLEQLRPELERLFTERPPEREHSGYKGKGFSGPGSAPGGSYSSKG